MNWNGIRHRIEYGAFRIVVAFLQCISFRQSVFLCECLAWLMVNIAPKKLSRYKVASENLQTLYQNSLSKKELHTLITNMWLHLFRMVCEIIQAPRKICLENSRESLIFYDRKKVIKAMSKGRPVLVLSGHFGNWEVAISSFGIFGYRMGVVARALDNPYLHAWFQKYREFYRP